jgi:polyketide cyclase/dehydrase/lipid transport protein
MRGEVSTHIDASPDRVWRLVSDVTRMGEWSPVCYKCEWIDGATQPVVGARFKGYNRQGLARWATTCEVMESDPGRVFSFRTVAGTFAIGNGGREMTRWRYELSPDGIGTEVRESFEILRYPPLLRPVEFLLRRQDRESGMRATLERLKAAAEG